MYRNSYSEVIILSNSSWEFHDLLENIVDSLTKMLLTDNRNNKQNKVWNFYPTGRNFFNKFLLSRTYKKKMS